MPLPAIPGRWLLFMKTSCMILLLCLFCTSCYWNAFPDSKYEIQKSFRDLVSCYKTGDTIIFKSSTNLIDSFIISSIDSATNNKKGFFINARNSKTITVHYRQIPIDKWKRHWIEMGPNNAEKKERSEDGILISIERFPDNETTAYYFNFKEFRCLKNEVPELITDSLQLNGYQLTNYYRIENCTFRSERSESIQLCFSTIGKGLVAFKTNDGIYWTKQN